AFTLSGTAGSNDYQTSPADSVTFAAGEQTADVTITPVDDSEVEGTETVTLTLSASSDYSLGTERQATIALADDDTTEPTVTVTSDDTDAGEGLPADGATLTFQRQGDLTNALTVNYTTSGTASADDYIGLSGGSVVIPADESSVTVPIYPVDDALVESSETL